MIIEGPRVILRPITENDLDITLKMFEDWPAYPEHGMFRMEHLDKNFKEWEEERANAEYPINHNSKFGVVLIVEEKIGGPVGILRIVVERKKVFVSNLAILPSCRGKGYGSEVSVLCAKYTFNTLNADILEMDVLLNSSLLHFVEHKDRPHIKGTTKRPSRAGHTEVIRYIIRKKDLENHMFNNPNAKGISARDTYYKFIGDK